MTITDILKADEGTEEFKATRTTGFFTPGFSLFLHYPKDEKEYSIQASLEGPAATQRKNALAQMVYFLEKYGPKNVKATNLSIELQNKQSINVEQNRASELDINLFKIDLRALEEEISGKRRLQTSSTSVLADIVKQVYGLDMNKDAYGDDYASHPFRAMKDPATGLQIQTSQGLKYGTFPQKKALEAIDKIREHLSESELDNLRKNYPELIKAFPKTAQLKSSIIQKGEQATPQRFADLLTGLPQEVDSISMFTYGNGALTLADKGDVFEGGLRSPIIQALVPYKEKDGAYAAAEDIWRVYQELTGSSLDMLTSEIEKVDAKIRDASKKI